MSTRTLYVKSADDVRRVVDEVVGEVVHARSAWAEHLLDEAAEAVAKEIQREYAAKAYGATDDAGIHWKTSKAAERRGGLTMIETGSLIESIAGDTVKYGLWSELRIRATNKAGLEQDPTKYAKYVFKGTKNADGTQKLPPRPAWPSDGTIPDSYWRAIAGVVLSGIRDEVERRLAA